MKRIKVSSHKLDAILAIISDVSNSILDSQHATNEHQDAMTLSTFGNILEENYKSSKYTMLNEISSVWYPLFKKIMGTKDNKDKIAALLNSNNKILINDPACFENTILDGISINKNETYTLEDLDTELIKEKKRIFNSDVIMLLWHRAVIDNSISVQIDYDGSSLFFENEKNKKQHNELPLLSILYSLFLKFHTINTYTNKLIENFMSIIHRIYNNDIFYLNADYQEKGYGQAIFYRKSYDENVFSDVFPDYKYKVNIRYQYTRSSALSDANIFYFIIISLLTNNMTLYREEFDTGVDEAITMSQASSFDIYDIFEKLHKDLREMGEVNYKKEELTRFKDKTITSLNNLNDKLNRKDYTQAMLDINKTPVSEKVERELFSKLVPNKHDIIGIEKEIQTVFKDQIYSDLVNLVKSINDITIKMFEKYTKEIAK